MAKYLNEFNIVTSQLEFGRINFKDAIRALLILSRLQDSINSLMMVRRNSFGYIMLKYADVMGVLLSEEAKKKKNLN